MDFTDRLSATDRAVSAYIRFCGEPAPTPSETAVDLIADLLHWHEKFVISRPPMSKREVRAFVSEAIKKFYEERDEAANGGRPLDRARRHALLMDDARVEVARARVEVAREERRNLRLVPVITDYPPDSGDLAF
jgi:hypothetical protein